MPERIEKLKMIVKELEDELDAIDTADPESRRVLQDALKDLHSAIGKTSPELIASDSLMERLRAAEGDFEVSHPTIAGLVVRMIHALGQLGI